MDEAFFKMNKAQLKRLEIRLKALKNNNLCIDMDGGCDDLHVNTAAFVLQKQPNQVTFFEREKYRKESRKGFKNVKD